MPSGSHWSRMLEDEETISNSALKSFAAASMPPLAFCQNEFVPLVTNTNLGFFVSGAPAWFALAAPQTPIRALQTGLVSWPKMELRNQRREWRKITLQLPGACP